MIFSWNPTFQHNFFKINFILISYQFSRGNLHIVLHEVCWWWFPFQSLSVMQITQLPLHLYSKVLSHSSSEWNHTWIDVKFYLNSNSLPFLQNSQYHRSKKRTLKTLHPLKLHHKDLLPTIKSIASNLSNQPTCKNHQKKNIPQQSEGKNPSHNHPRVQQLLAASSSPMTPFPSAAPRAARREAPTRCTHYRGLSHEMRRAPNVLCRACTRARVLSPAFT